MIKNQLVRSTATITCNTKKKTPISNKQALILYSNKCVNTNKGPVHN